MSQNTIDLYGKAYECNVILDQITADGGPYYYTLHVPVRIDFRDKSGLKFEGIAVKAILKSQQGRIIIGEYFNFLSYQFNIENAKTFSFQFSLTEQTFHLIENLRTGNLPLEISFDFQFGEVDHIQTTDPYNIRKNCIFIKQIVTTNTTIFFEIEQSFWINKILNNINFPSLKLIEVPLYNKIIPAEYAQSLKELEESQKYFLVRDYDKVVSHCRSAIEPFKKRLDELKTFITSSSEADWATNSLSATEEWLGKLIKSTSSFTSKAHHVPSVGHFGKHDAEIVFMITASLIAYIGKLQFRINNS